MPTRLRVDLAGYHHIINRGVNRCDVFNSHHDKEMFLQIMNKNAIIHKIVVHDYCLMDNHYHLLIETQKENLSTYMRILNANYAKYFNKKYKRSGHLWQDRYKSKYITSENYLYSLIRYIENNPLEASIVDTVGTYPYTLSSLILNGNPKGIYGYSNHEDVVIPEPIEVSKINQAQMQKYHEYNDIIDINSTSDQIKNAYDNLMNLLQTSNTDLQSQLDSPTLDFKTMDQISYEINKKFGKQYII